MAKVTSTPTAGSLTVSGNTQVSGTISWSKPTVPSDATISSCVLTGTANASMSKGSATITVNGTTVTAGSQFTINLGTANNTTSVTTTAKGDNKNSKGTVSFSNLVYTVTYEEASQVKTYTVTFVDWDGSVLKTQTVEEGSSATAPSNPTRNGYNFIGWDTSFNNITSNLNVTAQYSIKSYTVTFKDWNGTTLKTETVKHGSHATAPSNPTREGYEFTGWDTNFNNVTSDLIVTAQYIDSGEPEEDVIEWNGIGTVATGLRAHDVEHNNYKINIDWNTQCFDIIVTEDFNYLSGITNINIAYLDKIIIGNNIYIPDLHVNNDKINITIYGPMDETPDYFIERNYPYTIRFTKEGVYILYGSTSHLIMERDYDLDTIYFNEDGLDNEPLSGNENGDYDVAFDLAVSEYSGQTEEPETPSGITIAQYKFNNTIYNLIPEFNAEFTNYTYGDIVEGNTTTRTIYSDDLPTLIRFGEVGSDSDKSNSLLEVNYINTSNINDVTYMFSYCQSLTSVNTNNWDTSRLINIQSIFCYCEKLTSLDLSSWDTSNIKYMDRAFYCCLSLKSLDLSKWDTSNVVDIARMFAYCSQMTKLNLSGWNVDKVANTNMTFAYCNKLDTIKIHNCKANMISTLNWSSLFPTEIISGKTRTIYCDEALVGKIEPPTNWVLSSEKEYNIKVAQYKFDKSIYDNLIPAFNEDYINYNVVDESSDNNQIISRSIYSLELPTKISFEGQTSLIESNYLNTSNMTSAYNLFYNCTNLTYVDLRDSDFSKIETIERMFAYCSNLLTIDGLNDIDISNVNNMGGVFTDCSKIPELNVSNWNVSKVTNFGAIFRRCSKLTNIDVSKWNTSSGVIMSGIFTNCTGLIELDLSNWTVANSDTVSQMFYGCSNLVTLKLFKALPESSTTTLLFGKNNLLNEIQIDYLDTYTINTIISLIPTRTANNQGTLIVPKIDDYIDTAAASAKYWIVMADPTNIRLINLGDIIISNLYIGDIEIEKVYIGDIVIYENKQAVNDKELLYNKVTGTLFIIKKNSISYDADNQVLNIDGDVLRLEYSEDSLNIGGDA